jgi:deoxyribonuclease-1
MVDPTFEAAHNDLYNLFPAKGEINGDRKDYH